MKELFNQRRKYDIMAITEPPLRGEVPGTPNPRSSGYRVVQWTGQGRTRAAIFIGPGVKVADTEVWPDWCRATIDMGEEGLTDVVAVYSPSPPTTGVVDWETPLNALLQRIPERRTLLVGDFNLHSREWMPGRRYYHVGATKLRRLAEQ